MSIKLWFEQVPYPALEEKIPDMGTFIRLFSSIKFKTITGWSKSMNAIIDTGAPISVIPLDVWTRIEVKKLAKHKIKGVNPKEECALPASVGKVRCILLDEDGNQSDELEILSYLAYTNLLES
ncbi:MAG: hypothetical protein QME81_16465 [bacterium]|nr:hypothetical protein [bacterium]